MLSIRPATIDDAPLLRQLIWELADYERQPNEVYTTEAEIVRDGFGEDPQFQSLIAEWDSQAVGYALFFPYYSTWRGRGLYLEDLFVRPAFRGRGIGSALLARVARIAHNEKCVFMKWDVLNWNQGAIDLYKAIGSEVLEEWRTVFLEGDGLRRLAGKAR